MDREESPHRAIELDDGLAESAVVSDRPPKTKITKIFVASAAPIGAPRSQDDARAHVARPPARWIRECSNAAGSDAGMLSHCWLSRCCRTECLRWQMLLPVTHDVEHDSGRHAPLAPTGPHRTHRHVPPDGARLAMTPTPKP